MNSNRTNRSKIMIPKRQCFMNLRACMQGCLIETTTWRHTLLPGRILTVGPWNAQKKMVYNRGELPSPELQELLKKIQSLQGLCELAIANCNLRHPGLAAIPTRTTADWSWFQACWLKIKRGAKSAKSPSFCVRNLDQWNRFHRFPPPSAIHHQRQAVWHRPYANDIQTWHRDCPVLCGCYLVVWHPHKKGSPPLGGDAHAPVLWPTNDPGSLVLHTRPSMRFP